MSRLFPCDNVDTIGTNLIVLISEVSLFQGDNNLYKVGTQSSVLINQVHLFQRCSLREVLYTHPVRGTHYRVSFRIYW